jgi:hypothetical protein
MKLTGRKANLRKKEGLIYSKGVSWPLN